MRASFRYKPFIVEICPTHSIIETNFPPKKVKIPKDKKPKVTPVKKTGVKPVVKVKVETKAVVESEKPNIDA